MGDLGFSLEGPGACIGGVMSLRDLSMNRLGGQQATFPVYTTAAPGQVMVTLGLGA